MIAGMGLNSTGLSLSVGLNLPTAVSEDVARHIGSWIVQGCTRAEVLEAVMNEFEIELTFKEFIQIVAWLLSKGLIKILDLTEHFSFVLTELPELFTGVPTPRVEVPVSTPAPSVEVPRIEVLTVTPGPTARSIPDTKGSTSKRLGNHVSDQLCLRAPGCSYNRNYSSSNHWYCYLCRTKTFFWRF